MEAIFFTEFRTAPLEKTLTHVLGDQLRGDTNFVQILAECAEPGEGIGEGFLNDKNMICKNIF